MKKLKKPAVFEIFEITLKMAMYSFMERYDLANPST